MQAKNEAGGGWFGLYPTGYREEFRLDSFDKSGRAGAYGLYQRETALRSVVDPDRARIVAHHLDKAPDFARSRK